MSLTPDQFARFSLDAYFDLADEDLQTVDKRRLVPDGWTRIEFGDAPPWEREGFFGVAYESGNEIVTAFRGREGGSFSADNPDVAALLAGEIPDQFHAAWEFYEAVKEARPNAEISLTGHSLGGALASLVFVREGLSTSGGDIENVVVFNPVSARATAEQIVSELGGSLEHESQIARIVTSITTRTAPPGARHHRGAGAGMNNQDSHCRCGTEGEQVRNSSATPASSSPLTGLPAGC